MSYSNVFLNKLSRSNNSSSDYDTEEEKKLTKTRPSQKMSYAQNYKVSWEKNKEFCGWLGPSVKGSTYFKCNACNKDCKGGIAAVKKHSYSSIHERYVTAKKAPSVYTLASKKKCYDTEKAIKSTEIRVASFIAEHNIPISATDHLVELIKSIKLEPEVLNKVTCHRTKATALINNVIGATGFETVINLIKTQKFSLLVDESTDVSSIKHLALVVRINYEWTVKDYFLQLIPIHSATAQSMYDAVTHFFIKYQVPYIDNLIGFASDGANAMMGNNNSLRTLLAKDIPNIFVMKCICHSLALCCNYACLKLPDVVEKLVRSIYNFMNQSFKRQKEFQEFQKFHDLKPHKMLQQSQTRWLSLEAVVSRVLEQYEALKSYFRLQDFENDTLNNDKARQIYVQLNNPVNELYLEFLHFILPVIIDLNKEYQSQNPKLFLLYSRMESSYKFVLSCYIKPDILNSIEISKLQFRNPINFLPTDSLYFGPKVVIAFQKKILNDSDKKIFQTNCLNFYCELLKQFHQRFPFNSNEVLALKELNFFDPNNIFKVQSLGPVANYFGSFVKNINELDREWRLFQNSDYKSHLNIVDHVAFWETNLKVKRGDNNLLFPELYNFVKLLLSLPHSSACVERIFSVINLNKTKTRNRLSTETLCGLLHTK